MSLIVSSSRRAHTSSTCRRSTWLAAVGSMRALVGGVGAAPHEPGLLKALDRAGRRGGGGIEHLGKIRLAL
jgi:hypothetical protein